MTEAKFRDIVETMIEIGILDIIRALIDKEYFIGLFWEYVYASNTVRDWLHMEPLI